MISRDCRPVEKMLNCSIGTDSGPGGWPSCAVREPGPREVADRAQREGGAAGQRVGIAEEGADRRDIRRDTRASALASRSGGGESGWRRRRWSAPFAARRRSRRPARRGRGPGRGSRHWCRPPRSCSGRGCRAGRAQLGARLALHEERLLEHRRALRRRSAASRRRRGVGAGADGKRLTPAPSLTTQASAIVEFGRPSPGARPIPRCRRAVPATIAAAA